MNGSQAMQIRLARLVNELVEGANAQICAARGSGRGRAVRGRRAGPAIVDAMLSRLLEVLARGRAC